MPKADFGQPIKLGGGLFFKLKSLNEQIKFRFAAGAIYEGKHFLKQNGDTIVTFCPKIMNDLECDYCSQSWEFATLAKNEDDEKQKKALSDEARKYRAKITFYYPIVDREDGKAKILQTVLTVREAVENEIRAGVKVIDYDYILTRTEKSPASYYSLVRSPETQPLSKAEKVEYKKAKAFEIEKFLKHGGKESKAKLETDNEK